GDKLDEAKTLNWKRRNRQLSAGGEAASARKPRGATFSLALGRFHTDALESVHEFRTRTDKSRAEQILNVVQEQSCPRDVVQHGRPHRYRRAAAVRAVRERQLEGIALDC